MTDLIRREDLVKELNAQFAVGDITREIANDILNHIPSTEPERKTGHWIDTDNYYQRWKCSECGCHTRDAEPNYCPNCGADMRGKNGKA